MGYTTSTVHGIEVPDSSEANNVPEDIGKVVTALEGGSLNKRLTQTQIDALTTAQKPNGLVVFNTTTGYLQQSNGSTFRDVASRVATDFSVIGAGSTGANVYIIPSVAARPSNLYLGVGSLGASAYRWLIRRTAATETGGSTGTGGSEFEIQRFDNSGTLLGTPVTIRRSDGRVTLERSTVAGDDALTVVTKDYADAIGVWQNWTPVVYGGTTALTGCTVEGRKSVIGKTVHWNCEITIGASSGGSGTLNIGGDLPEPDLNRGVMGTYTNDADTLSQRVRGYWNGLGATPPQILTFVGVTLPQNGVVFYAAGTYEST